MHNSILLVCSLSSIALSLFAADSSAPTNTNSVSREVVNLPDALGERKKYTLKGCGDIICSSPHYIASVLDGTGISIYDRKNNYAKAKWNLNNFKNIFTAKAIFLGDDRLATIESSSNQLQVTSVSDHDDQTIYNVFDLNEGWHINDLHPIPQNPKKLLINCAPLVTILLDMERRRATTIELSSYSIPDNTGNGAWYLSKRIFYKAGDILGHWDFRSSKPTTSIETDYFINSSLALSQDNNTCAMMCINQIYKRELRIFDLRTQKNSHVIPMVSSRTDISSLSFVNNDTLFYKSPKGDGAVLLTSVSTEKTSTHPWPNLDKVEYHQNSNLFITYPHTGVVHIYEPINQ
jgi:hypothetical protein